MEKNFEVFDNNGNPIPKEQFLENALAIYDEIIQENYENTEYLNALADDSVDTEKLIETYDFYNRILYITTEIEPELAVAVHELISLWNHMDAVEQIPVKERTPIKIIINTPGGCLSSSFTIIDSIRLSTTPVHTYTIGTGYSGGFFIGISGHKRFGYPHSSYCFHEGSVEGAGGDAHKFIQNVDFFKKQLSSLKEITLENTLIEEKEYDSRYKDDWFMTAKEALELGVIDEISTEMIV